MECYTMAQVTCFTVLKPEEQFCMLPGVLPLSYCFEKHLNERNIMISARWILVFLNSLLLFLNFITFSILKLLYEIQMS
jgi:hypothetical protein